MRKTIAKLSAGIGAVLTSAMLTAPALSFADSGAVRPLAAVACPDIQVVFARGTGEPPGPGRVGQEFASSRRGHLSTASPWPSTPSTTRHPTIFSAQSMAQMTLRQFVESTPSSCPQTKVVLGGYSQGAAVVDLITVPGQATFGFGDPLQDEVADHVAAVAVFGNPSNRVEWPTYPPQPAVRL